MHAHNIRGSNDRLLGAKGGREVRMLEDQVGVLKAKLEERERQLNTHAEARARDGEREKQQVARLSRQLETTVAEAAAKASEAELELDGARRELKELREAHAKLLTNHKAALAKAKAGAGAGAGAGEKGPVVATATSTPKTGGPPSGGKSGTGGKKKFAGKAKARRTIGAFLTGQQIVAEEDLGESGSRRVRDGTRIPDRHSLTH